MAPPGAEGEKEAEAQACADVALAARCIAPVRSLASWRALARLAATCRDFRDAVVRDAAYAQGMGAARALARAWTWKRGKYDSGEWCEMHTIFERRETRSAAGASAAVMQTDCFELANMCRASHPAVTVAAQRVLALAAPRPDLDAQHAREFDDEMCLVEWSVCGCELRLAPTNEALELGMVRKQEVIEGAGGSTVTLCVRGSGSPAARAQAFELATYGENEMSGHEPTLDSKALARLVRAPLKDLAGVDTAPLDDAMLVGLLFQAHGATALGSGHWAPPFGEWIRYACKKTESVRVGPEYYDYKHFYVYTPDTLIKFDGTKAEWWAEVEKREAPKKKEKYYYYNGGINARFCASWSLQVGKPMRWPLSAEIQGRQHELPDVIMQGLMFAMGML